MNLFVNDHTFLISRSSDVQENMTEASDGAYLYGYVFTSSSVIKNRVLTNEEFNFIEENHGGLSGIFCVISKFGDSIKLFLDPLVQYPIFYSIDDFSLSISNDLWLLSVSLQKFAFEERYIFDSLAYQSPLRGLTIVKDIFAVQYDDLSCIDTASYKKQFQLCCHNFQFVVPSFDAYEDLDYESLLSIYIEKLNVRAKILAHTHEEVHLQLTGGADSRLVLSSFLEYENVFVYCYGTGKDQNRLCFEALVNALNLNKVDKVEFCGKSLSTSALIIKGVRDSNARKLNNLNTYMNADEFVNPKKCKVTGYYGANISGGVVLPPEFPEKNQRISSIPSENFTYHRYVDLMKARHALLRKSAFNDVFYINNRGPSHYGAHSIADNLKCNSFDILYDPINLWLVRKCPYEDFHIDKNAISVDLIYLNNKQLALFPYESRKIPSYKKFKDIPLLNCFDGLRFSEVDIAPLSVLRPEVDESDYDILNVGDLSISDICKGDYFDFFFDEFESLKYLKNESSPTSMIASYCIFSVILLQFFSKNGYRI